MPRFAANVSLLFPEAPLLGRFALARRAGFAAVELQFPYAHPAAQLAEHLDGLPLVLHNLPPGDWAAGERGLAALPGREGEFQDSVGCALDYAQQLGVRQLHCMAGVGGAHATFVANLRFAATQLKARGMRLLIEPLNRFDVPGYFLSGSAQALAIIDEVGADNLLLQYDVYHMQRMEGELAATLRANLARIGHIQVADNPGRHEPGTGEINYPYLFGLLDALGYAGWVGCEYVPQGDTVAGLAWRHDLSLSKPG
ncbi:MAG: 2-oxo-tetronate isomerase [Pseudomonadota bacterium]